MSGIMGIGTTWKKGALKRIKAGGDFQRRRGLWEKGAVWGSLKGGRKRLTEKFPRGFLGMRKKWRQEHIFSMGLGGM